MKEGWIYLHRSLQDHWVWNKYPFSYGQAWVDLLFLANYEDKKTSYKGNVVVCERGVVNLSISSLADRWHWGREKTRTFLRLLEQDNMVVVNATRNRTTITIVNYDSFQVLPSTNRATNRQRTVQQTDNESCNESCNESAITNKRNKVNKEIKDIVEYLNEKAGTSYKPSTANTVKHINARLNEGYSVEDFKTVIDTKVKEWKGNPKMEKFLRPDTLFGSKFESYLNQGGKNNEQMGETGGYTNTSEFFKY